MQSENWKNIVEIFEQAADLAPGKRTAFLFDACPTEAVRREVEAMLAADIDAAAFIETPAFAAAPTMLFDEKISGRENGSIPGDKIGVYRIEKEIGRGGMGAVYLAARDAGDFQQQVALKVIKRGMDTDLVVRRFRQERQILAKLNHPNIARLFDGGTTEAGTPYFVMEYVRGEELLDYCNRKDLIVSERLALFRKICAAVSYAHQNLIVHRDLKPSNVLITEDGEPKLLDFGISKILTGDEDEQETGTATALGMLTPKYASPEQFRGETVSTATDVYSLGVILYELLTGNLPYELSNRRVDEIARIISETDPIRPSSLVSKQLSVVSRKTNKNNEQLPTEDEEQANPKSRIQNPKSLRGDLDNIILKALRKEAERRYASVQEFSEDIRRHLEGKPVTATADTAFYRIGKFTRRHRAAVFAFGLIFLTLLSATAITSWQAVVARREREKAERRFADVRQLAHAIVFEFHDSIQNLPGSTPTRELLIGRALEYLDKLAGEAGQDRSLQAELADAYDKIGDIQGGFAVSHLGQREKAVESYGKALAIREALVAAEPGNVDFRRGLAISYTKMGKMRLVETDMAGSAEMHEKAFAIYQRLVVETPENSDLRLDAAASQADFGNMLAANGKLEESLENVRQAIAVLEELSAAMPADGKIQAKLALAYDVMAGILDNLTENYSEALVYYRKSQAISEKLFAADTQNTTLRRGVAVSYYDIAGVSEKLGENQTALENARKSLEMFSDMLDRDPQNEEFKQIVAAAETQVAGLMIKTGNSVQAIKELDKSLAMLEKLLAASPNDEIVRFRIANVHENSGKAYAALASETTAPAQTLLIHWREARTRLRKSFEIYKSFRDAGKTTGEDAAKVDEIAAEISRCDAAISRLTKN